MTITILDFEQSKSNSIDYDTVQKVWGENVKISVVLKEGFKLGVDEKEKMLRSYLRVISAKLKFVEENRGAINAAILSSDIAGFSEEDLKALYINWALFVSFADTGDCELTYIRRRKPMRLTAGKLPLRCLMIIRLGLK